MSEIYFDNSSTTKVCPEAAEKVVEMMTSCYGNPSSLHTLGFQAEQQLTAARSQLAKALGARDDEITFTSGGTESNNIALLGAAHARHKIGKHIVTTAIEHPAVLNVMKQLEKEGFTVTYLQPDNEGKILPQQLMDAVTPQTILVSMMAVNNEVGSVLPIQAAAAAISAKKAPALLHVDAVQAFGKMVMHPQRMKVDLMSVSAHKIHGPKGIGALYVKKGVHILPHSFGGGQEKDLRPGTESMPLIAGFGAAVAALPNIDAERVQIEKLNAYLREELEQMAGITVHSGADALPYILNFSVAHVRAETMLHYLSSKEIYLSSGSACSKGKKSHVLTAMKLPSAQIDSALRLSFCRWNTIEEADLFLSALRDGMKQIVHRR